MLSQLKIAIRTNYSNPPIHGGAVVAAVLNDPARRAVWEKELAEMRVRIKSMRQKLVDGLKAAGVNDSTWWGDFLLRAFRFFRIPYTQVGAYYNLKNHKWYGPGAPYHYD